MAKKTSLVPVKELIAVHQDRTGYGNNELAQLLGYSSGNIIAMLKAGSMRLPFNKLAITAEVLHIDLLYLSMCFDAESNFGLTPLLTAISKRTTITLNEEKLITRMRKISDGIDIDLEEHPQQLEAILAAFTAVAEVEKRDHAGAVGRLKGKKRAALANEDRKLAAEADQDQGDEQAAA